VTKSIIYIGTIDISTRPKRRRAVSLIVNALSQIHYEEDAYQSRIPLNLQGGGAYNAADDSISYLVDAICTLSEAY